MIKNKNWYNGWYVSGVHVGHNYCKYCSILYARMFTDDQFDKKWGLCTECAKQPMSKLAITLHNLQHTLTPEEYCDIVTIMRSHLCLVDVGDGMVLELEQVMDGLRYIVKKKGRLFFLIYTGISWEEIESVYSGSRASESNV